PRRWNFRQRRWSPYLEIYNVRDYRDIIPIPIAMLLDPVPTELLPIDIAFAPLATYRKVEKRTRKELSYRIESRSKPAFFAEEIAECQDFRFSTILMIPSIPERAMTNRDRL